MRKILGKLARREHGDADRPSGQHDAVQPIESAAQPVTAAPRLPTPTPSPPDASTVSEDLWCRAYEALSAREPDLTRDYEKLVRAGDDEDASRAVQDPEAARALVAALQQRRADAQYKVTLRSRDVVVGEQIKKLVKLLALADGVVKQALSGQPYAALAWSTVSVFIPLLSGGFARRADMVQGFTTIGELQQYWRTYEAACLPSILSDQYKMLAKPLSNVYSHLLEYQIRAVCHLSATQLSRAWRDVAGDVNWKETEAAVIKMSDRCLDNIAPLQQQQNIQSLATQNETLQRISVMEQGILQKMDQDKQEDEYVKLLQALRRAAGDYVGGRNINYDLVPGTCEWFFTNEDFVKWRDDAGSGVFWLTAGPGCGKSVLAKTLIKAGHLTQPLTVGHVGTATCTTKEVTVCYFFFRGGEEKRMTSEAALCALLHQLLSGDDDDAAPGLARRVLDAHRKNGEALMESFHDLWAVFLACAESLEDRDLICVMDALDECEAGARNGLISALDDLYKDDDSRAAQNIKFFITSRPYDTIEHSFRPFTAHAAQYFRFDADERYNDIGHDINLAIDTHMASLFSDLSETDCQKIATSLKAKGTKTYLWLGLTVDIIRASPSLYSRRTDVEALMREIPRQVSDAYEKILSKSSDTTKTSTLLGILLAATRPLTLDEANCALAYALAEADEQETPEPWRGDFKTTVKNLCGLIINVYDSTLFFIHQTAREFLSHEPRMRQGTWQGRFADACLLHTPMAKSCMQYLVRNLTPERQGMSNLEYKQESARYPLLLYASLHWPHHFRASGELDNMTMLVAVGADTRLRGHAGETPADLARSGARYPMRLHRENPLGGISHRAVSSGLVQRAPCYRGESAANAACAR